MAGVEIGTLRLRGPPHLATRAAFRIEDGLRTELSDTQRLILIRRMRPERRAVSGRPEERAGAIGRAYAAATRDARHGRDAGDGAFINCVWFESPAEARRLLLAQLLAGRPPTGWFWRLAVPEWRGRTLEEWLVEIVSNALGGGEEGEYLALVLLVLERADIDVVVRAVQAAAGAMPRSEPVLRPVRPDESDEGDVRSSAGAEPAAALRGRVDELRARLPAPLRDPIEALARRLGPGERPVRRLLERLLLHASPSLALAPGALDKLALAWSQRLAESAASPPLPSGGRHDPPVEPARIGETEAFSSLRPASAPGALRGEPRAAAQASQTAEALTRVDEPRTAGESFLVPSRGCESDSAGLWLVIPSLIRLGFREWLREQPHLLGQDAGRMLLRTLARRYRLPDGDPALAPFEDLGELGDTPDWASCWRSGLDGWLLRRTRIPLHRLVRKRGEVKFAEEALTIRFPLDAADIRLRRRALDVDPGWVDWLGLSVRYRYEGAGR